MFKISGIYNLIRDRNEKSDTGQHMVFIVNLYSLPTYFIYIFNDYFILDTLSFSKFCFTALTSLIVERKLYILEPIRENIQMRVSYLFKDLVCFQSDYTLL